VDGRSGPARIVINALAARRGGGPTYAENLLAGSKPPPELRVFVLAPPELARALPDDGGFEVLDGSWPARSVLHRALWERLALPRLLRRLRADVYYPLSGALGTRPPPGCRSVVAFRNLLPFAGEWRRRYRPRYTWLRLLLLRATQARSLRRADLVIFVSEHGRRVIDALLPARRGRSVVIPHGVSDAFFAAAGAGAPPPDLPGEYVLYASILDVYKAQLEVLDAWARLRARRPTREKLVLAGPEYPSYGRRVRRRIAELGLGDEVRLLGPVPRAKLPALYRGAKLNLFASRCENCPNILLEALAAGRPVLASQDPPMPEIAGGAAVLFDAGRPGELAERLAELLDDPERVARLGTAARERARGFGIEAFRRRTWDALRALAESEAGILARRGPRA